MSFLQLRFHVERARAGDVSDALEEQGALSVTWENAGKGDYLEAAFPGEPDWPSVRVTGLFESSCRPEWISRRVSERLGSALTPQVMTLDEQDWERAFLDRVQPRRYQGDLWICPSWIEPPDPAATNVVIDPGLAFGTGDHPTTALCLDWISGGDWGGRTVLDYGCGSGVLAIACLLKGAGRAWGIDVDPRAVSASVLNAERNGVAARYSAATPDAAPPDLQADVVLANILSNVLIDLRATLSAATAGAGRLLLTGILDQHAGRVRQAYSQEFEFEEQRRDGWCLLIGRKRETRSADLDSRIE